MNTFFISDLHLSEHQPIIYNKFKELINNILSHNDTLYIVGDFFNYWLGQDCINSFQESILAQLSEQQRRKSLSIFFLPGNRDFLMEQELLTKYQITLLPDPHTFSLGAQKILLSHGDLWCTDNKSYQCYRKVVRSKIIIQLFKMLSPRLKNNIADRIRRQSKKRHYERLEDTQINLEYWQDYDLIIHGHTHNPLFQLHPRREDYSQRIVLSDWNEKGNYLKISENTPPEFIFF